MPKVRTERKSYRKSPGRQYGYEYDPLHSRSGRSTAGQNEDWTEDDLQGSQSGTGGELLSRRPDARRTRQLMRKSIIASKTRTGSEEAQFEEQEGEGHYPAEEQYEPNRRYIPSRRPQSQELTHPHLPSTQELMDEEEAGAPLAYPEVDPDAGYEEAAELEPGYEERGPYAYSALPPVASARQGMRPSRALDPRYEDEYEDYEDEFVDDGYEEEQPRNREPRRRKKRKMSRRGLIVGLGAAAVGAGGVVAYELAPQVPQAIGAAGANIERQLQDAFNKGLSQGADNARKEIITSLENLEGFTLEGAVTAARLTRVAYDVFVSPVIKIGATVATDFLDAMLKSFKTARMLLAGVYQDNVTLQSIQKVLETWVAQVSKMPQQLDTITQTDLDGAQAYLRELQRKIEDEKAKLNGTNPKSTAPANSQPTAQPTSKPN
jgi:hypothetical protein